MKNVDERTVQLNLDNRNFETNAKKSMNTIDKLSEKLEFKDVSESIKKIEVEFSKLEMVTLSVISNITNRVVNLGIQMVKSLSVDNISAGWAKFGQKTQSVATIAAQSLKIAGKEITNVSEKMEIINEQLDKLNWYTDETSYNFTDMVDNIGKFTAAGQDLDKSVSAMMGIANWAALSGQNATVASRAMYNLAQAMGKGYVQLIDYKSIQNASMDTQEFRQVVLDTAVAMKELTNAGDKYITKTGKSFTKNQFAEQLGEKWFTSDVLVKSLEKYSSAVEEIYTIAEEKGMTASAVIEKYGDQFDEFAIKAFKAAQEARTFADALSSVKDAVSTGWLQFAENLFGGYDESVKLWTELANRLYDVFTARVAFFNAIVGNEETSAEARANLFKVADEGQGAFWNIYDAVKAIGDLVKSTWNELFPISSFKDENEQISDLAKRFLNFTAQLKKNTESLVKNLENNKKLTNIFRGLFSILGTGIEIIRAIIYALDPLTYALKDTVGYLYERLSSILGDTSVLESILEKVYSASEHINESLTTLLESIDPVGLLSKLNVYLKQTLKLIKNADFIETFSNRIKSIFETIKIALTENSKLERSLNGFNSLISLLGKGIQKIISLANKYVLPIADNVISIIQNMITVLASLFSELVAFIGDIFTILDEVSDGNSSMEKIGETFNTTLTYLKEGISKLSPIIADATKVLEGFIKVILLLPKALDNLSKQFTGKGILEGIHEFLNNIEENLDAFQNAVKEFDSTKPENVSDHPILNFLSGFHSFILSVYELIKSILSLLGTLAKKISEFINKVSGWIDKFNLMINDIENFSKTLLTIGVALITLHYGGMFIYRLIQSMYYLVAGFPSLIGGLADALDGVYKVGKNLGRKLLAEGLGELIKQIANSILKISIAISLLSFIDFSKAWPAIAVIGGLVVFFTALSIALSALGNTVTTLTYKFMKVGKNLAGMVDTVTGFLDNFTYAGKIAAIASVIKSFGKSILMIAAACLIFNKIEYSSIDKAARVMFVLVGSFIAIEVSARLLDAIIEKPMLEGTAKHVKILSKNFSSLALALLACAKSIQMVCAINAEPDVLDKAYTIVRNLILTIMGMQIFLNKFSKAKFSESVGSSIGFMFNMAVIFGSLVAALGAIYVVYKAFLKFYEIDKDGNIFVDTEKGYSLIVSILSIITMILFFVSVMRKVSKFSSEAGKGTFGTILSLSAMIISISFSIYILLGALALLNEIITNIFGDVSGKSIFNAIVSLTAIIILVEFLVLVMSSLADACSDLKPKTCLEIISMSLLLSSIIGSVYALAGAISIFGNMNLEVLKQGGIAVGSILVILGTMMNVFMRLGSKMTDSKTNFTPMLAMLTVCIFGIATVAGAIAILGNYDTQVLKQGGNAIAQILLVLTAMYSLINVVSLMRVNESTLKNLIAMAVVLTVGLAAVIAAITYLGNMPFDTIKQGGIAVGIIFGSLVAIYALMNVISLMSANVKPGKILATFTSLMIALYAVIASIKVMSLIGKENVYSYLDKILHILGALSIIFIAFKSISAIYNKVRFGDTIASFLPLIVSLYAVIGAIAILGSMDYEQYYKGLYGVLKILATLSLIFISFKAISAINNDINPKEIITVFATMIASLYAVIGAIAILGSMDSDKLKTGGNVVGAIMGLLSIFYILVKIGSEQETKIGEVISIFGSMVASLYAVIGAIAILGSMPAEVIKQGGNAVGMILGLFSVVFLLFKAASAINGEISFKELGAVATVLTFLTGIIAILALITKIATPEDISTMTIILASLSGLFSVLLVALKLISMIDSIISFKEIGAVASVLTFLTGIIAILALITKIATPEDISTMTIILASLSGLFSVLLVALKLISMIDSKIPIDELGAVASVLILLTGIIALLALIARIATPEDIAIMAGVLSALMAVIYLLTVFIGKIGGSSTEGITSLLLLSATLLVLSGSLLVMSLVPMNGLAKNLLLLAAALAAFIAIGFIASKLNIGEVFKGIATSSLGIAASVLILVVALGLLATQSEEFFTNITSKLPVLGDMFRGLLQELTNSLPYIGDFIRGLIDQLAESVPNIMNFVKELLLGILQLVIDTAPKAIEALFSIILAFLQYLEQNIPIIVYRLINILAKLIVGVADGLQTLFYAIEYLVLKLVELLFRALPTIWDQVLPDSGFKNVLGYLLGIEGLRSIADGISNIANSVKDELNKEIANAAPVITPVLDLSSVNESLQVNMGNTGTSSSVSGQNASKIGNNSNNKSNVSNTTNNSYGGDTYNSTFNIVSDDPEETARVVNKQLNKTKQNEKLTKGVAY